MGIFRTQQPANEARVVPSRSPAPSSTTLSIIGTGMTVRGDLDANGVVKIEGTVEGNVRAATQVLVAKGGSVQGDVDTTEAVVGGTVSGSIRARDRVEIQSGASVHGDITTRRIAVAEGGTLNGLIRMDEVPATGQERVSESRGEVRQRASMPPTSQRPVVPLARIAVPPRTSGQPT